MKYWIFDLDGTLVNSFAPFFEFIEKRIGKPLSETQRKQYVAQPAQLSLSEHLTPEKVTEALIELDKQNTRDADLIKPFEHIPSVISHLHGQGRKISICTSRDLKSASLLVERTGLGKYIDHLISGDCVKVKKPDPEGLLKIQSLYKCAITEMVMIGDHDCDVEAGKNAGTLSIRASWHKHWDDGKCHVADKQFFCDHEFYKWVKSV
jgi:HAD superfamily hydrolase (TIGR01549 family)